MMYYNTRILIGKAFLVLLILSFSCTKKESPVIASGDFSVSLTASLPEMPIVEEEVGPFGTKASTLYTVRIKWNAGDKLSVVNLTTGKLLGGYLKANSSGTSTTFSGSVQGTVNNGDQIAYFYPAVENESEIAFPGIHIDMSNQKGTSDAVPLCVYSIVTANENSFSNAQITFSYLMSYIMVGMSDIPASTKINSVRLTNVTDTFDVSINDSRNGFNVSVHTGDVVLTPNLSASVAGVRTIYVALPGSASAQRKTLLETETNTFETNFVSSALTNGYAYNTNVSGFLRDNLAFKDILVQNYCTNYFDKNGDGKLSMVEIASVTSFPASLPAGVLCFCELEFFYGLTALPSFANQASLTEVAVPSQLREIPDETFAGCTSLLELYMYPTVPPVLGNNVFSGKSEQLKIIVPDESLSAYQTADGWKELLSSIYGASEASKSNVRINEEEGSMGSDDINITF